MSNNKQQTAVEWFVEQLPPIQQEGLRDIIQQAIEMERKHIMKAHISAGARLEDISIEAAEEYYNKTYGNNK